MWLGRNSQSTSTSQSEVHLTVSRQPPVQILADELRRGRVADDGRPVSGLRPELVPIKNAGQNLT